MGLWGVCLRTVCLGAVCLGGVHPPDPEADTPWTQRQQLPRTQRQTPPCEQNDRQVLRTVIIKLNSQFTGPGSFTVADIIYKFTTKHEYFL